MSLRGIRPGTVVVRTYYAVCEHAGTIGTPFDSGVDDQWAWDEAVTYARQRYEHHLAALTESLGDWSTPQEIIDTARAAVRIDLRWALRQPSGGSMDIPVESYKEVDQLRTSAAPVGGAGDAG